MQNHDPSSESQKPSLSLSGNANAMGNNKAKRNDKDKKDELRVEQINATTLAYLGDSVYEVYIREHLICAGNFKVDRLHKAATKYVSAKAQSMIITKLREDKFLTDEEEGVFKRGKNRHTNTLPKNTSPIAYKEATGFEALIGYLYILGKNDRIIEIINKAIEIVG